MNQEPIIIGRAASSGLPSDIPVSLTTFPGAPLEHRFSPTEQTRLVEEPHAPNQSNIASTTPFSPVASVSFPDKKVYIGPVSNAKPRNLSPIAVSGTVAIPASSGQVYTIPEEVRTSLEARANKPVITTQAPTQSKSGVIMPRTLEQREHATAEQTIPATSADLTELEKLKKLALEELAKRAPEAPPQVSQPIPLSTASVTPLPPSPPSIELKPDSQPTAAVTLPLPTSPEIFTSSPAIAAENPENILSQAEKLETELAQALKQISPQEETKKGSEQKEYVEQISKLVFDRTDLLKKVNELTNLVKEETEKRNAAEIRLESATKEFTKRIQAEGLEKDTLISKVRVLEDKFASLSKESAVSQSQGEEITQLKSQITVREQERKQTQERLSHLESLLETVRREPKAENAPTEVVKTESFPTERPELPQARVIRPQIAIGKMAPSLTNAPNVINGIVKDSSGLLLSNVVIVVKDPYGEPVRAFKTNKIGQFAISTPLPNGTYTMVLEIAGHNFDIVEVELEGKVLPPVEIRSNN